MKKGIVGWAIVSGLMVVSCGKAKPAAPVQDLSAAIAALVPSPATTSSGSKPVPKKVAAKPSESGVTLPDAPGLHDIQLTTGPERPDAWRLAVRSDVKLSYRNFAPENGIAVSTGDSLPSGWLELGAGPLAGRLLHLVDDTHAEVISKAFVLTKAFNFEDRSVMRWACDPTRSPIPKTITVSSFTETCKDAVRGKLAQPDTADFHSFGINSQVLVSVDCEYAWTSDVTAKNAFGTEIKSPMKCSYAPKTGLVESSVGR